MQKQVEVTVNLKFYVEDNLSVSDINSEVTAALEDVLERINSDIISADTEEVTVTDIHEVTVIEVVNLDGDDDDFGKAGSKEKPGAIKSRHPNGFDSWHETHFEICYHLFNTEDVDGSMANVTQAAIGRGGLYELAEKLTNDFEAKFAGKHWDGEFFDEIDKFLEERNRDFKLFD